MDTILHKLPYTKLQRAEIYEKILWTIGDDNRDGVCITLLEEFAPRHIRLEYTYHSGVKKFFPEFYKAFHEMMPEAGSCSAFLTTPEGNEQRRVALERAIQLCNN